MKTAGVTQPLEKVLDVIKTSYASNVMVVAHSVNDSFELYNRVKCIPSSTTRLCLETSMNLHINGAFQPGSPLTFCLRVMLTERSLS